MSSGMGHVELKGFDEFLQELQTLEVSMDGILQDLCRELAARLLALVIPRTPVAETDGGTLRRGWIAQTEEEAWKNRGSIPSPTEQIDHINKIKIARSGSTYTITVTNPVHYASYVEKGHRQTPGRFVPAIGKKLKASWVKGQFFLEISENTIKASSQKILEKKLKAMIKQAMKNAQSNH